MQTLRVKKNKTEDGMFRAANISLSCSNCVNLIKDIKMLGATNPYFCDLKEIRLPNWSIVYMRCETQERIDFLE